MLQPERRLRGKWSILFNWKLKQTKQVLSQWDLTESCLVETSKLNKCSCVCGLFKAQPIQLIQLKLKKDGNLKVNAFFCCIAPEAQVSSHLHRTPLGPQVFSTSTSLRLQLPPTSYTSCQTPAKWGGSVYGIKNNTEQSSAEMTAIKYQQKEKNT